MTVRNVITSMRLMSAVDWAELFESVSLVDAALRADSDFAAMDFATRDHYRHAIEALARGSGHPELEVAQRALLAAERAQQTAAHGGGDAPDRREQDPGYYLISKGRRAFETELGFRVPMKDWLARANAAAGILGYLGTIAVITAFILALSLLGVAARRGRADAALFVLALLRSGPGVGCGRGAGEPQRHESVRRDGAAGTGAARRRAVEPAHDGRRPHAADDASGDRGADRASRGASSGESGGRPLLRAALGLDGRRHRELRQETTSCSPRPPRASRA